MSKAFTKESDHDSGPTPELNATVPGGKNYMTPMGAKRLEEELHRLTTKERPDALGAAETAASGNPAYLNAKKRLQEIDRRLRFLVKRLEATEIIDPTNVTADHVLFGATVTIRNEQGEEKEYSIVGIDEADAARGRISWLSPLAQALMRTRVGDIVTFRAPRGSEDIEIIKIEYRVIA